MPMLQIGSVAFTTTGPHYDKLKNSFNAHWARQKRFGRSDAMQWTGEGEDDVSISGTIYTDYYAGFGSLASLRAMSRRPQMVVSGAGDVFGRWCILNVTNEQTLQDASGVPRKVTFDIKLTRYGEDQFVGIGGIFGLVGNLTGGLSVGATVGVDIGGVSAGVGISAGLGGVSINGSVGGISAGVSAGTGVTLF